MERTVNAVDLLDNSAGSTRPSHDHATDKESLDLGRLEAWLRDIRLQPAWRLEADKAADYYDGNQLDAETLAKLEEKGLGPLVTNLIKPTVDAVLGLEAKTRTDWMVVCDDERNTEVAEFYNQKLYEAEREARADRALSDGYAGQVKAGFAAVEVSRSTNPFDYPYRVKSIHRRELYWDWHSVQPDWSDARYLVRKRWLDTDVVAAHFPDHAPLIQWASKGAVGDWTTDLSLAPRAIQLLQNGVLDAQRTSIEDMEWRDLERARVCVFEVWYRTWHRGAVIELPTGRKVEYDHRNPQHIAIAASGVAKVKVGVFDRLRCAYFVGPHRIADFATNRRRFPYVPLWGYREDNTGTPYGLIRSMMSPQDEVNARRAKMMWLLSQKRILIDSDALDQKFNSLSQASFELARADAFVVMNQNRLRDNAIKIDENLELGQFQFRLLEEAKNSVQQAGGVYAAMLGQATTVTANSAIQSLIEQGTTTLAEINDNFAFGRRLVGEALLDLIREDSDGIEMQMLVDTGTVRKSIHVNRPAQDQATGQQFRENDTTTTQVKVQLSDVPSTPSYRQQEFVQLAEVTKSLPDDLKAIVTPFLLEASQLRDRKKLAALLRQKMGMAEDPDSPEAKQAQDQQTAIAQQAAQLAQAIQEGEGLLKRAQAEKTMAEAEKIRAEAGQGDGGAGDVKRAADAQIQSLVQQIADLKNQLSETRANQEAAVHAANVKAEADVERARIEREKEELRAEADIEIARINGEAEKKVQGLLDKIEQVQQQMGDQIKDLKAQLEADRVKREAEEAAEDKAEKPETPSQDTD